MCEYEQVFLWGAETLFTKQLQSSGSRPFPLNKKTQPEEFAAPCVSANISC